MPPKLRKNFGAARGLAGLIINLVLVAWPSIGCKPRQSSSELLDLAATADAFFTAFTVENSSAVLDREFKRMPLQAGTNIFSFDFEDLARLTGGISASVRRLDQDAFLRSDTWRLSTDLIAGSQIQDVLGNALPVNFNIRAGRDITYMRVFANKIDALKALPMSPLALPLTSNKASEMRSGDFVSLPVYMGVTLGVSRGAQVPSVATQASMGMIWQGEFRLNVSRLDGNFVRVKLAPKDSEGFFLAANAGVQLNLFGYGPFGVIDIDRQAERAAGLDILRLSANRVHHGEAMVIDYVFNLDDKYGRLAYEAMLENTLSFRPPELLRQAALGVENSTFADVTLAETLHALDINREPSKKRVARIFRGARFFSEDASSGHFGTRLLRFEAAKSLSINQLKTTGAGNEENIYFYNLFTESRKQSSWFSHLRRNYQNSSVALFASKGKGTPETFNDIIFTWDATESRAKPEELAAFAWSLYASLGPYFHDLGLGRALPQVGTEKYAAKIQLIVHAEMFEKMIRLAEGDPELFEKRLWMAIEMITPRFQGRLGARTPAPAVSLFGKAKNLLTETLISVQQKVRKSLSTDWQDVYRPMGFRLVETTSRLRQTAIGPYFRKILEHMYEDETAREIVPAFFLALCEIYEETPFVSALVSSGGIPILDQPLGSNPREDIQKLAASAFQRINQTGYER